MKRSLSVLVSVVATTLLGSGVGTGTATGEEVYTATLVASKGIGKKTAELTLTVLQRSTQEDADRLQDILETEGSDAVIKAMRAKNLGTAKIKGGPSRTLNHVRVHPGENGSRVVIVTDQPLYFPTDEPDRRPRDAVGIVQLIVSPQGFGSGQIGEAVAIDLREDGTLIVQGSGRTTIKLENVKQIQ